jgi:hypothetical protein
VVAAFFAIGLAAIWRVKLLTALIVRAGFLTVLEMRSDFLVAVVVS